MLSREDERRQPWRTPTDVWNQSPTVPCTSTVLLAFELFCLMASLSFWSMLHFFIAAHNTPCHTLSNAFSKINKDVVDVLLVLAVLLTRNSDGEDLFCGTSSTSKASLLFGYDLLFL